MFGCTVSPPSGTACFVSRIAVQRFPLPSRASAIRQRLSLSCTTYQLSPAERAGRAAGVVAGAGAGVPSATVVRPVPAGPAGAPGRFGTVYVLPTITGAP